MLCISCADPVKPEIDAIEEKVKAFKSISVTVDIGSSVHSLDGNDIALRCRARGMPEPKVTWSKQGVPLQSKEELFVIRSARKSDSGNYTCIATNLAGSVFKTSNVIVKGKPSYKLDVFSGISFLYFNAIPLLVS